jgi:DNA transposition AAA+ family ATPase
MKTKAATAKIVNLGLIQFALKKLIDRQDGLPGLGVFYGPSGFGKTTTTVVIANEADAYYVQMRSAWTKKALLDKILVEMGMTPAGTMAAMLDQICAQLAASRRPLIIDEFDYAADKTGMVELVRDIYEGSQVPVLLVGEERLPQKLKKFERFHGRVLAWVAAQPVSIDDARALATVYANGLEILDEVLSELVRLAHGSVRRVCVNLTNIFDYANVAGLETVSLEDLKAVSLFTGEAPARRLA